ncbi:cupin domain-containing protein [Tropicimonas sp. IMCC34043]|uniref:cupin domain-containing protein n=1 Tax=Tropicimonas sp. IMCC34043 TaxID=2248760 RepID=UPI000E2327E8|nr:cupin domain-containing protein [Tropicimonas sp. IMCC34043]
MTLEYLHLTEDDAGVSHFNVGQIAMRKGDFAPPAPPMMLSDYEPSRALVFLTLPAGWVGDQHPSPARQVAFCLAGRMRIEAGDGEVREIGPGGIWRMEDVAGAGHISSVLGHEAVQLAIVQI